MAEAKLHGQFDHHKVVKMTTMFCDNSLWDTEPRNHMIENENSCSFTIVSICRHHLDPFCKVVDYKDDISMTPRQVRVTSDELCPFIERNDNYNWSKRSGRCSHFSNINLESMAFSDCSDAIFKH